MIIRLFFNKLGVFLNKTIYLNQINSKNYKKIAIGNHNSEGYFRVALELIDKPSKYDVKYEDNLITISKIN